MIKAIETEKVTKKFGDLAALQNLNLAVESGELFGLLGPNGAGKTTLLRILATLLPVTSGRAWVAGFDVRGKSDSVRRKLGMVSEGVEIYPDLTVYENLVLFGRLYGIFGAKLKSTVTDLLELTQLSLWASTKVIDLSAGLKKRALIALALVHDPPVLFLDEVTLGLDPKSAITIRNFSRKLASERGKTILWTTHVMEEPEKLCDRLGILSKGRLIYAGTPEQIKKATGQTSLEAAFISLTGEAE